MAPVPVCGCRLRCCLVSGREWRDQHQVASTLDVWVREVSGVWPDNIAVPTSHMVTTRLVRSHSNIYWSLQVAGKKSDISKTRHRHTVL